MGPNISINWNASEGNKLTFPYRVGNYQNSEMGQNSMEIEVGTSIFNYKTRKLWESMEYSSSICPHS